MNYLWKVLSASVILVRALALESSSSCLKLFSKYPNTKQPQLMAVVASKASKVDEISWVRMLPLITMVYSKDPESDYFVLDKGFPSSTYLKFIIDHYACMPRYVLFLQDPLTYHPLDPSVSSSLFDLNLIDRGYISLGHMSPQNSKSVLHPASEGFSAGAPAQNHKALYVSVEVTTYVTQAHIHNDVHM
jgi:hypothetical protein